MKNVFMIHFMAILRATTFFRLVSLAFERGDSCTSQLLSITYDMFKGFNANPPLDTRGICLDISKACVARGVNL